MRSLRSRVRGRLAPRRVAAPLELSFPLRSARLELRPFTDGDVAPMLRIYGDPEVMRWVGHGAVRTEEAVRGMLAQYAAHQLAHGFAFWAVVDRRTRELIGDAGLALAGNGELEMGYTLARDRWGEGLGTEVAGLCAQTALEVLGFAQVRALVEPENQRSLHVLGKLGFQREGMTTAFGRPHLVLRRHASVASG